MTMTEQQLAQKVGRDDGSAWPSYAWPGGYTIAYVMGDCELLCADCMNREDVTHGVDPYDDKQWNVIGVVAFGATCDYPEYDELCAHCNAVIESGTEQ